MIWKTLKGILTIFELCCVIDIQSCHVPLPHILLPFLLLFQATPCGQIPVLNYNGVEISQSMAITRFLANEFGLAGKTNLEKARADM